MRSLGLIGLLLVGCGSSTPDTLATVRDKGLLLIANFTPPQMPPVPAVIASLQYARTASACPSISLSATLDGVSLAPSPAASGSIGDFCQAGFFLTSMPPPPSSETTLRFTDGSSDATVTTRRLLDLRTITAGISDGGTVRTGDDLTFDWSVDSDQLASIEAIFFLGTDERPAQATVVGATIHVAVPALTPGNWTLQVSVFADPPIAACDGVTTCTAQVFARRTLALSSP